MAFLHSFAVAYPNTPPPTIGAAADHTSFYQLKTMLQGVVARGTARAIGALSPYVAGKTGTTEDSVDGWFIGFTNDVTIAVWVGHDNGDGKRRSLGSTETGARLALPIFEPIINAVWSENIAPKAPLSGPSPEAQAHLTDLPIDFASGQRVTHGGFVEHFRLGPDDQVDSNSIQASPSWSEHSHGQSRSGVLPSLRLLERRSALWWRSLRLGMALDPRRAMPKAFADSREAIRMEGMIAILSKNRPTAAGFPTFNHNPSPGSHPADSRCFTHGGVWSPPP